MAKITKKVALELLEKAGIEVADDADYNTIVALVDEHNLKVDEDTVQVPISQFNTLLARLDNLEKMQVDTISATVPSIDTMSLLKAINSNSSSSEFKPESSLLDGKERADYAEKMLSLIRCKIRALDPLKSKHTAEDIIIPNPIIGAKKYTIEFNVTTHIPYIVYKVLKDRTYNQYSEDIHSGDKKVSGAVSGGSSVKEAYAITVLKPLSASELEVLRQKQLLSSDSSEDRLDSLLGNSTCEEEEKSELEEFGYNL